jgi:hypothetical protein
VEGECVRSLGQLHHEGVIWPLVRVILFQLHAQASCLHSDGRVALRIESSRPAQYLGRDLVFLEGHAGMIQRVLREIAEQLAQRFRPPQAMTIYKFIYLLEALLPPGDETAC